MTAPRALTSTVPLGCECVCVRVWRACVRTRRRGDTQFYRYALHTTCSFPVSLTGVDSSMVKTEQSLYEIVQMKLFLDRLAELKRANGAASLRECSVCGQAPVIAGCTQCTTAHDAPFYLCAAHATDHTTMIYARDHSVEHV